MWVILLKSGCSSYSWIEEFVALFLTIQFRQRYVSVCSKLWTVESCQRQPIICGVNTLASLLLLNKKREITAVHFLTKSATAKSGVAFAFGTIWGGGGWILGHKMSKQITVIFQATRTLLNVEASLHHVITWVTFVWQASLGRGICPRQEDDNKPQIPSRSLPRCFSGEGGRRWGWRISEEWHVRDVRGRVAHSGGGCGFHFDPCLVEVWRAGGNWVKLVISMAVNEWGRQDDSCRHSSAAELTDIVPLSWPMNTRLVSALNSSDDAAAEQIKYHMKLLWTEQAPFLLRSGLEHSGNKHFHETRMGQQVNFQLAWLTDTKNQFLVCVVVEQNEPAWNFWNRL